MKKLLLALALILSFALLAGCGRNPIMTGDEDGEGQGGVIIVTVLDEQEPAADATVQLRDASNNVVTESTTSEDGTVNFENVAPGTNYSVIAEKGGVTGSANSLRVSGTEKTLAQIILKGQGGGGILSGTVKVSGTGRPAPGALVEVINAKLSATTDTNGQFTIKSVPAGQQKIRISCNGFTDLSCDVAVKDGGSVPLVVELYPVSAGPRAGHTLISTTARLLEVDTWHNVTMDYRTKGANMARFIRQTGNVLVADTLANKAAEYTSTGSLSKKYDGKVALFFGGVDQPRGVSRTSTGNVLVADTKNNRIVEIDSSNNKVWEYKTRLSTPNYAERLANGNTLIVDSGNNRVVEIDRNGTTVWGCGNGTNGTLSHPTFATRLANGNTLITDSGNSRVMEVNANNMVAWSFGMMEDGSQEEGDSKLMNPGSAVRLANGNTLIADTGNDRVIEVNGNGEIQWDMPVGQPTFAERM